MHPLRSLPLITDSARAINPQLQLPHHPPYQRVIISIVQPSKPHARTHRSKDAVPVALPRSLARFAVHARKKREECICAVRQILRQLWVLGLKQGYQQATLLLLHS